MNPFEDPKRRALMQFGLGMLGNAGTGQGLGVGLANAGTQALGMYDQMVSQQKQEQRQKTQDEMKRREFEQMSKQRNLEMKRADKELKMIEDTEKGRQNISKIVERIPSLEDPVHQERVARNALTLGSMYGMDVSDIVAPYTREGKLREEGARADIDQRRVATRATESDISRNEQLLPLQIEETRAGIGQRNAATRATTAEMERNKQLLPLQIEETRAGLAANQRTGRAADVQAQIEMEKLTQVQRDKQKSRDMPQVVQVPGGEGRELSFVEQGGEYTLLPNNVRETLTGGEAQEGQEAPPPAQLSPDVLEAQRREAETKSRKDNAMNQFNQLRRTVNDPLYRFDISGGDPQQDLATLRQIYNDLPDEEKRKALDMVGRLQEVVRRKGLGK